MNFVKHHFGSYQGYLTHLRARLAQACGQYAAAKDVDWERVGRFVFVCKGNVCRSPYAQEKARSLGIQAISMGLDTTGNVPANPAALRNAQLRGVDLRDHRSMPFDAGQLRATDLLLAFEPVHTDSMRARGIASAAQVTLVGLWSHRVRPVIADPYGKSDAYFQVCFDLIDTGLAELARLARSSKALDLQPKMSHTADKHVAEP